MITILYVDDEPALLDLGRLFLERSGEFRVITASSGREALGVTGSERIDAIVSDYQMPGMDGIELLRKIREQDSEIPFILFTGKGREEIVIQAINHGADFYLQKGGDPSSQFVELEHKVKKAVGQKRDRRELTAAYGRLSVAEEELRQHNRELERSRTALTESRQLLQSVLDTIPVRVFWKDTSLNYLGCNLAFAEDAGFSRPQDLVGKSDSEMSWSEEADRYRSDDKAVIASGQAKILYEEPQTRTDGQRIWLRTTKIPLRDPDGSIRGVLGTYEDISAQKRIQDDLRTLAEFPAQNPNPVMRIDGGGILRYANPASVQILESWPCSQGSPVPDHWRRKVDSALKFGAQESSEELIGSLTYLVTTAPVPGEPLVNLYFRDITDRKKSEDAVLRRNDELQMAYQQLSATDTALRDNFRLLIEQQGILRENEEKYRNLFEAESDALLLIDNSSGSIIEANHAATALYGYSHGDLLTMKNTDLSAEPDQTRTVTQETPLQYNQVVTIPLRWHRKRDGTSFPVEITGRFFVWQDRPVHIAAIRDVTERVRADEDRKARAARSVRNQRALVQLATTDAPTLRQAISRITETGAEVLAVERVSLWFMSADGTALACNDRYIKSRNTHEEGARIVADTHPRFFAAIQENRTIVAPDAGTHPDTREFSENNPDTASIRSMLSVTVRSGKDVIGVLSFEQESAFRQWDIEDQDFAGALADYTAIVLEQARRRLAEKDLKKSEEKYRAVVDRANDGIVIVQGGVFTFANPKAAAIFGYPLGDLIGRSFLELVNPAERDLVRDRYRRRKEGEDVPGVYEISMVNRKQQPLDVELNAGIITFEGNPADLVFIRDISDRKRSEQALWLANQKLNLLSSVTRHDILNKLTIIIGYLELARMTHDREKLDDFILKIDATVQIVEEQIQFTYDYQDMGLKDPEWQDAAGVFMKAVAQLDTGTVIVRNHLGGLTVFADPLLTKVLYNILDNALRYGDTITTITAGYTFSGDGIVLSIEDDGIGIPAKDKGRIFDKGFGHHTGLGLFLVKEILSLTGIGIMETGFPGRGARFELHIPAGRFRITPCPDTVSPT